LKKKVKKDEKKEEKPQSVFAARGDKQLVVEMAAKKFKERNLKELVQKIKNLEIDVDEGDLAAMLSVFPYKKETKGGKNIMAPNWPEEEKDAINNLVPEKIVPGSAESFMKELYTVDNFKETASLVISKKEFKQMATDYTNALNEVLTFIINVQNSGITKFFEVLLAVINYIDNPPAFFKGFTFDTLNLLKDVSTADKTKKMLNVIAEMIYNNHRDVIDLFIVVTNLQNCLKTCTGLLESNKNFTAFFQRMEEAEERMADTKALLENSVKLREEFKIEQAENEKGFAKVIDHMNFFTYKAANADPVGFFKILKGFLDAFQIALCANLKLSDIELSQAMNKVFEAKSTPEGNLQLRDSIQTIIDEKAEQKRQRQERAAAKLSTNQAKAAPTSGKSSRPAGRGRGKAAGRQNSSSNLPGTPASPRPVPNSPKVAPAKTIDPMTILD